MITYLTTAEEIEADQLQDFFVGWPNPPSSETHLRLLKNSDEIVAAIDDTAGNVVGYVSAITDRVLSAYISSLEVLPAYQHRGIGTELVRRVLKSLNGIYMIDLLCDPDVQPFYESLGMRRANGMLLRNYENQSGLASPESQG